MKNEHKTISQGLFRSILILGLIIGFLSITLQAPMTPSVEVKKELSKSDEGNQKSDQKVASITTIDAITSSLHLDLSKEYFVVEILPDLGEPREESIRIDHGWLPGNKVLNVLFRRIISPNAP